MPSEQPTPSRAEDLFSTLWQMLGSWTVDIARPDADLAPTAAFADHMKLIEKRYADALRDAERLETMFKRCRITFYPKDGSYPLDYDFLLDPIEVAHRREMLTAAIDAANLADGGTDQ